MKKRTENSVRFFMLYRRWAGEGYCTWSNESPAAPA